MRSRPSKTEYMMSIAFLTARMSTCDRLQVGCVLADQSMETFWVGYNGGPRGGINECRFKDAEGGCGCVHAEANAVVKAPGTVEKIAFLTHSPCVTCAVMLVNAHVTRVVYVHEYRDHNGLLVLRDALVSVEQRALQPRLPETPLMSLTVGATGGWYPR